MKARAAKGIPSPPGRHAAWRRQRAAVEMTNKELAALTAIIAAIIFIVVFISSSFLGSAVDSVLGVLLGAPNGGSKAAAAAEQSDALRNFTQWFEKNGGQTFGIAIAQTRFGMGVVAKGKVSSSQLLINAPKRVQICASDFRDSPQMHKILSEEMMHRMRAEDLLTMQLVRQLALEEKSRYRPYIDVLPKSIFTAVGMSHLDRRCLHEHHRSQVEAMTHRMKDIYSLVKAIGTQFFAREITLDEVSWAFSVAISRAMAFDTDTCLVPYADMFNHDRRRGGQYGKVAESGLVQVQMPPVPADDGDELFLDYHHMEETPTQTLMTYGFFDYGYEVVDAHFEVPILQRNSTVMAEYCNPLTAGLRVRRSDGRATDSLVACSVLALMATEQERETFVAEEMSSFDPSHLSPSVARFIAATVEAALREYPEEEECDAATVAVRRVVKSTTETLRKALKLHKDIADK